MPPPDWPAARHCRRDCSPIRGQANWGRWGGGYSSRRVSSKPTSACSNARRFWRKRTSNSGPSFSTSSTTSISRRRETSTSNPPSSGASPRPSMRASFNWRCGSTGKEKHDETPFLENSSLMEFVASGDDHLRASNSGRLRTRQQSSLQVSGAGRQHPRASQLDREDQPLLVSEIGQGRE